MENTNRVCQYCHSENIKSYSYGRMGFRSTEVEKEFYKNNIMAGCEMSPEAPVFHCLDCNKDFGRLGGEVKSQ